MCRATKGRLSSPLYTISPLPYSMIGRVLVCSFFRYHSIAASTMKIVWLLINKLLDRYALKKKTLATVIEYLYPSL